MGSEGSLLNTDAHYYQSLQGIHVIWLVLSCCDSFYLIVRKYENNNIAYREYIINKRTQMKAIEACCERASTRLV